MLYVKATVIGLFVFVLTQVVMFWNLFVPIRSNVATGLGAVEVTAWRAVPLGIGLFVATFIAIVRMSRRPAH